MSFTKLTVDVENVQALDDRPNSNSGLTADQVKAVFDKAGEDIKEYLNNTLTPELDSNSGLNIGIFNVMSYGATGNGVTDDTAAIQAAVNAVHTAGGGIVYAPKGIYLHSARFTWYSNVFLVGAGIGNTIFKSTVNGVGCIDMDAVTFAGVRNLTILSTVTSQTAYGVNVRGNCTDILLENVYSNGFTRGFDIAGGAGTVAGVVNRITLRGCTGYNNSQFGINIDECDTVTLDDCYGLVNGLDGAKLRKKTFNVTIKGGSYSNNVAGDGLDAYAGGDTFSISDTIFNSNGGAGITIKTGALNDASVYGYTKNAVLTNIKVKGNTGNNVNINRDSGDVATYALVANVSIVNMINETAGAVGLYIRGRNVKVIGGFIRKSVGIGIDVRQAAMDVDLIGVHVQNCNTGGAAPGVQIGGTRVNVIGGSIIGVGADTIAQDSDYSALTKTHTYAIRITSVANDITVRGVQMSYFTTKQILHEMTTGRCITEQYGTGTPESAQYGAPGCTFLRLDGSDPTSIMYLKVSGYGITGWVKLKGSITSIAATPVFIGQTAIAAGVGYMAIGTSSTADWKQIT